MGVVKNQHLVSEPSKPSKPSKMETKNGFEGFEGSETRYKNSKKGGFEGFEGSETNSVFLKNNNAILNQRINFACKWLYIDRKKVFADISSEDIKDIINGYISANTLRVYVECLSKLSPNKMTLSEQFFRQYSVDERHAELLTGDIQFIKLQITPNQVREDLSAEDIADILSGCISTEMLRIYAQCLDDSLTIRF